MEAERKMTDELMAYVWMRAGERVSEEEMANDLEPDGLELSSEIPWTVGRVVNATSDEITQGFDAGQRVTLVLILNARELAGIAVRGTRDEVA